MSGNNTTSTSTPRNSNSPELWIPYIMIGVSCVTFLAVHFWCYHKRNRERYLRKRDEKRVKSGLLERRRITTLMLAKYQSDLGITHKDKDIELTQLFYDNNMDVIFDECDNYKNVSANKNNNFYNFTFGAKDGVPHLESALVASSTDTSVPSSKTIANSQTWPLSAERKTTPYNAHDGCSKDESRAVNGDLTNVVLKNNNSDNNEDNFMSALTDQHQRQIADSVFIPHQGITVSKSNGATSQKVTLALSTPDKANMPQTCVLKTSSPSTAYPSVFYSYLTSPSSSPSSIFSAFKTKQKKKRYDETAVEDSDTEKHETNENIGNKWEEFSRLHDPEETCSNPYTIYGTANSTDCDTIVNSEHLCCTHRKCDKSGFDFLEDEAVPFAEGGLAYGSMSHQSDSEIMQMIPLGDLGQCHADEMLENCTLSGDSCVNQGKTATSLNSETLLSNINNPMRLKNRFSQQNIIIPFSEKSRLNIISKNPGKIRTAAAQALLNKSDPGLLARTDTSDTQNSTQKLQLSRRNNQSHNNHPETAPVSPIHDINNTQILSSVMTSVTDRLENIEPCVDFAGKDLVTMYNDNSPKEMITGNDINTVSKCDLKTFELWNLDRNHICHSTKRKLETKTD